MNPTRMINAYRQVIEELIIAKDIVPHLQSRGVEFKSADVYQRVSNKDRCGQHQEAARLLLDELLALGDDGSWFQALIESLDEENFQIPSILLKGKSVKKDHKEFINLLTIFAPKLSEVNVNTVLTECVAKQLITTDNKEEVKNVRSNTCNKDAVLLLLTYIYRRRVNWFKAFMEILRQCDYCDLAGEICGKDFLYNHDDTEEYRLSYECDSEHELEDENDPPFVDAHEEVAISQALYVRDDKKERTSRNGMGSQTTPTCKDKLERKPKLERQSSSKDSVSEDKQYLLTTRKRAKKCQGCGEMYSKADEAVLKVYETHGAFHPNKKKYVDTTRDYYYHPRSSCVQKVNPHFVAENVKIDNNVEKTISRDCFEDLKERGFPI